MTFFFSLGKGDSFFFGVASSRARESWRQSEIASHRLLVPLVFVSAGREPEMRGEGPLPVFISACCNTSSATPTKYVL